ncbi:MAG: biotin transporter BioY [bacterium]
MAAGVNHSRARIRFYVLSSLMAALTAVGAFIKIPIPYVPLTLQTFFVMLSGSILGPNFGALSQLLYLTVGLIGVPVFAYGGGPGYVLQPTFGYLLSYPIAAFVIGYLIWGKQGVGQSETPGFWRILRSCAIGVVVIYALGVSVLYLNLNHVLGKPTSFAHALWIGGAIFLPGTIIKLILNAYLASKVNARMRVESGTGFNLEQQPFY